MPRPSIYEFAGGQTAFAALAAAHHQLCLDDPVLNHPFSHPGHPQHLERLAGYWGEVFGGPPAYTQAAGGHTAMLYLHSSTGADRDLGDRFVRCFVQAADDAGLPADPEFRAALVGYLEWGTRIAMHNSQPGADVVRQAPVPHWDWGVAPPYQPG
jgi:hemoglobin